PWANSTMPPRPDCGATRSQPPMPSSPSRRNIAKPRRYAARPGWRPRPRRPTISPPPRRITNRRRVRSPPRGATGRGPPPPPPPLPPLTSSQSGNPALPKRFLLWVDGVGGYLVCLSHRVTFGQATSDGPIDVPLFADVSRLHAEITRDGEGYVVESGK